MGFKSHSIIFILLPLLFSITGCKSSSMQSVPDAPPPYPNFPVPQERFNSAQVYGGQPSNAPYVPPILHRFQPAKCYPYFFILLPPLRPQALKLSNQNQLAITITIALILSLNYRNQIPLMPVSLLKQMLNYGH